jgi:hypothetical protein
MIVKGEGLIRIEAERLFMRRCGAEYEDMARERGHIEALRFLVAHRKKDYDACVRDARGAVRGAAAARTERAA